MQKIFYVHVPLAIVALGGFVFGGDHGHPAPAHARRALRPALLRGHPPEPRPRGRRAHHRLDLGQGELGALVGVGRADARLLPRRLPALRDLPAAALLDRGPRAPGPLRERVRDHRGRLRPAELPGRAPGPGLHPSARVRDDRRRPAGQDAAALLPVPDRDGAALRHAVEVRDGLQAHLGAAALAAAQARRRRRGGAAAGAPPPPASGRARDRRAAGQHRLRRRRLPRLLRAGPHLRGDHGRQAVALRARAVRARRAGRRAHRGART